MCGWVGRWVEGEPLARKLSFCCSKFIMIAQAIPLNITLADCAIRDTKLKSVNLHLFEHD